MPGDAVYDAGALTRPGTNAQFHLVDERLVGRKPATLDDAAAGSTTAASPPATCAVPTPRWTRTAPAASWCWKVSERRRLTHDSGLAWPLSCSCTQQRWRASALAKLRDAAVATSTATLRTCHPNP
ncbi:hypothetical protein NY98_12050 [Xanthomonas citri pv. fuscans]|uniref:Uncharacterized protein n=2 Tax=Xanthomonas citri TaxID=346 RepID=A0AB34Q704_XANCI|nr:hypothetical protein AC613_22050 [Xanthomonas citri pv. fuscans]KGP22780.1 hypothetical protein NY65_18945 [Xanthomonas phaseoli pv. phaseoli]AZU23524.1 hypothetical protein AC612_22045 [Xanthomonas citri pv. fuscans]AZU94890.1 hypothetical protein AC614_22050 [Xanthomonas citri pv. fuscans]KGK66570.1 hypothetical protein NB99_07890 [Xanthomonas citri pv. fuscans]